MALAIRLSRGGRKARPFYRIVVADKRMPRDGRYIERLGTYDPLLPQEDEKRVQLVKERIEYWLSQGAKPTDRVAIFLGKAGIIPIPEVRETPKKSAQSEKTKMRMEEKAEKRKAAAEAAAAAEEEAKAAAAEAAEAPAEEPAAEAPAEEAPAEEAAAEAPAEEAKEEAPAEDAPAEEPATEAPAEEAPAEEAAEEEKKDG